MNPILQDAKMPAVQKHVLWERNMRWYFGTQLISLTGLMLRSSLLSLLLVDLVGPSKAAPLIGMVWALNVMPGAFLGVFAGIFLDRFDKRRILVVTAVLGLVQAFMLAYLSYVHDSAVWKIMLVMLFTGFTNTLDGIGRNAIIKDAVIDPRNMRTAGVVFNSIYTIGMVLGQGLAGHLVERMGYGMSFVLNGLSFLVLIFGLSKMDFSHSRRVRPEWKGVLHLVNENFHYILRHPGVRLCILLAATVTLFGFAYNVILAVINKMMFNGSRQDYSYLASVAGIGSFVGSILSIIFSQRAPKMFAVGGCLIMGIAQVAFSQTTNLNHGAALLFFCGFGFMCAFLPFRGALMHIVEPHRIGIVLGITFMFFYGGMMLSSFGAGYIAKHFGCPAVLAGCGTILIALGIVIPFIPGIKEIE